MITLGLHTAILPDKSFSESVDIACEAGLSQLEVCCWPKGKALRRYAGVTHIDINAQTPLEEYARYAREHGVRIAALGYYPNPMDPDMQAAEIAQKHILHLIDAAAVMGVNLVSTFVGRDKNKTVEENLALFEQVWTPLIVHAENRGVRVAIENCAMLYTANEWPGGNNLACAPYIWRRMFERINSDYFGLAYDPSHLRLMQMDPIKPIYQFGKKIFHVHFKDILIRQEVLDEYGVFALPALWHTPKIPGMGDIDFGRIVSALNDVGFDGCGALEIEDRSFEGSERLVRCAIEQSTAYMRRYLTL